MLKKLSFLNNRHILIKALVFVLVLVPFLLRPVPVGAIPVEETVSAPMITKTFIEKAWDFAKKAYEKGGAAAFQKAVRTALNKVAFDTASWLGSGNEGQKPMFVTQGWGDYLAQIGDEAAGSFIEDAVNNWNNSKTDDKNREKCSADYNGCIAKCNATIVANTTEEEKALEDCESSCEATLMSCGGVTTGTDGVKSSSRINTVAVCQPSSIDAKLKIAMGLVDYNRPQAPNCSASKLISNWSDAAERMVAFKDPSFLDNFSNIFNPVGNDLGIYLSLKTDMTKDMATSTATAKIKLAADGGFLDLQNIAGDLTGLPGDAAVKKEIAEQGYVSNMATFSGDALIDAANVFLNQLALTAYSKLMSNLGKTATSNSDNSFTNSSSDPNIRYGETAVKESAASIIEPDFGVRADYDILSTLSICRDRNNPGPTECVIDDKLMQAVTEKKTVAEAIKDGYLHKNWLFTSDYRDASYSLRNLEIMRKYRLIPVSWEVAAAADKQASLIDLVSCFSANDEYNEYSSGFNVNNQSWCRNLVDPNWVLKAPLNYCAKQGFGSQIIATTLISTGIEGQDDTIQIAHAEDYCADEQSCIQERADGSCEAYGYCESERRTWSFDSSSCEPIDNTCSAFINTSNNQRVAYLENTLDYANCNADAVGCKRYSLFGVYDQETSQVNWSENTGNNAYFNSNLSACSSADEACTEMIRVKPGWGLNLIMGADFADDNIADQLVDSKINNYWNVWSTGSRNAEIIDASDLDSNSSGKVLFVHSENNTSSTTIGVFSDNAVSLIPENFNILSDETYTLSADVYITVGDNVDLILGDYLSASRTTDKNVWRHVSVTRNLKEKPLSEMAFSVTGYSSGSQVSFAVRNMKLEMTAWDSGFSSYGNFKVYEQVIPPYLADICYVNSDPGSPDYRLRTDAPSICDNYARQCNRDEAGCERYQEASTGFQVAAQAVSSDYCDATCNGYDLYVSKASYFYSPFAEKMIPKISTTCGADAAGCSAFTNLDAVAAGGEGQEYYTQLKQCIKPSDSCADFYTWVGTEESGYQLKALSLKKDTSGNPAVTSNDSALCSQEIFNLTPSDPSFNPDCRQFYNKAGNISYHLSANTITCSDNCHAYRLADNNIDSTVSQADCSGSDRSWNVGSETCYVCKNGGVWSNQDQACIYQAIPDEGKKCTAKQNGCREYNGSLGNNTRMIGAYSFEIGLDGWGGQCGDAALSSQVVNTNNGHSLYYDRGANFGGTTQATDCDSQVTWLDKIINGANANFSHIRRVVGTNVVQGQAYSVKFTASASATTNVQLALMNKQGDLSYFDATEANPNGNFIIPGDNEWRTYELNLASLDHEVDNDESLIVVADKDFYLDNMVLTAINDRYYLIKDSSDIPDVCYYDMLDNYQGPDYNLGCSLYRDRSGSSNYLRQFSKLCQDSAVGCELMINTANYNDYKFGIWQDTNNNGFCDSDEDECVKVNGDRFFYAIYDESKRCNSADLGCSRLGESLASGSSSDWSDVFKKNNPNNYDNILCAADDAGCEAWKYTDGSGISYFKNPGSDACVYRISSDTTKPGKSWYKVPVMRCDLDDSGSIDGTEKNQAICSTNSDCSNDSKCLIDNNDYDCPVSYFKTFGFGGGGNQVPVPSESAALCQTASSGCSEYIDPVSTFSANLITNPTLENNHSGWEMVGGAYQQALTIQPNKLYILSVNTPPLMVTMDNNIKLQLPVGVSVLQDDNNLSTSTYQSLIIPQEETHKRIIFHSRTNTSAIISGASGSYEVQLKEAILDYQFKQNIDKTSCNGLVNFDNGCVLFNERSVNGAQGLLSLSGGWNAAASTDGNPPSLCTEGNCSANQLIKVRPNRVCASWLDCLTYAVNPDTQEKTCYALGLCNRLDDKNECSNFVAKEDNPEKLNSSDVGVNKLTGYSLLNQYDLADMKEVGLNTEAHYDFESATQSLDCRTDGGGECVFDNGLASDSIINSPNNAPTDYPAEGKSYLRVMVGQQTSPHSINSPITIQPSQDYYLNYLVNTKGSGYQAAVYIYDHNKPTRAPIVNISSSTNGWERKVFKIEGLDDFTLVNNVRAINVYLGAANASNLEERYVYFDDVNIEPVLKVNDSSYVAKECRLYPGQDSISCTSKNSQVVSDGLVGYCLQHDPANKSVCLVWYPVDEISSAAKSGRSNLGYQGAFPLNYCTDANANFDLVEMRGNFEVYDGKMHEGCNGCTDNSECGPDFTRCYFPSGVDSETRITYATAMGCDIESTTSNSDEGFSCDSDDYFLVKSGTKDCTKNGSHYLRYCVTCVPIDRGGSVFIPADFINPTCEIQSKTFPNPGTNGWYVYNGLAGTERTNSDPNIRVFDYDHPTIDEDQLKLISSADPEEVFYPTCNQFVQVVDAAGNNKAWAGRTSKTSVYPFETPLFFRYNPPPTGSGSDIYYGLANCYIPGHTIGDCSATCSCGDQCWCNDPIHGDTCHGQCAGMTAGDCYDYYTTTTPDTPAPCSADGAIPYAGQGSSIFDMTAYGRNRSLVPFGAATFPDNFNILNSSPVKFLNQYSSKIDQTAFAGRPYGCSGVGCDNIGYCSLNPNVLCLLDTTTSSSTSLVNQRSCGSANGTCVALWNGENIANDDINFKPEYVLSNIFNKDFAEFTYNSAIGTYNNNILENGAVYSIDYTPSTHCGSESNHLSIKDGSYDTYNCAIWPVISAMKLDGTTLFNNIPAGIHILTFNTKIDAEQQPLKDLVIDWGDGSVQNLVNQDHHPDLSSPHKVYHYYASDNHNGIKIKITDNWGSYRCLKNGTLSCD